jgi:hypothetical protein
VTRSLSLRELNRALLARQLLLERRRLPVAVAVSRLAALQAQYNWSPYVALWARLDGFRKTRLTRALERRDVVYGTIVRPTLHVVARRDYPFYAAAQFASARCEPERRGLDVDAASRALPDAPISTRELGALVARAIGSDERWDVEFTQRALPILRLPPAGTWRYRGPIELAMWREPLPPVAEAARHFVRRTLAAFGPMTLDDVRHFAGLPRARVEPALEGLRLFEDEEGRTLYDVSRAPLPKADLAAAVRFLPPFDSAILAHRDRRRIIPLDYHETVIRRVNATTLAPVLVDGFVAGHWKVERRRDEATLTVRMFEPVPRRVHGELEREGDRLVRFVEDDATTFRVRTA